jgi:hypothetical protein
MGPYKEGVPMIKLVRGDKGPEVKVLQRALNRLGSMLLVDGDFGSSTELAVLDARALLQLPPLAGQVDDVLMQKLQALPEPSQELTSPGVTFVGREEVSSPAAYRAKYLRPVLPPEASGITIGIGYDLRFSSRAKLDADWGTFLTPAVKDRLAQVCGKPGTPALLQQVKDIEIPLPAAMHAFLDNIMPEHVGNTRSVYPQLDSLPPPRRTALISLVFNRGPGVADKPGSDRRREMKKIQTLLASNQLDQVGAQIRAMKRLWQTADTRGLVDRREREAMLWTDGFAALQLE